MKRWEGIGPYEDFLIRLQTTNPALYYETKGSQQRFNVAAAATSGANTPYHAASTFIRGIQYRPSTNLTFVTLGNKQYYYPMTDAQLAMWMKSKSLGQYYNNFIKLK